MTSDELSVPEGARVGPIFYGEHKEGRLDASGHLAYFFKAREGDEIYIEFNGALDSTPELRVTTDSFEVLAASTTSRRGKVTLRHRLSAPGRYWIVGSDARHPNRWTRLQFVHANIPDVLAIPRCHEEPCIRATGTCWERRFCPDQWGSTGRAGPAFVEFRRREGIEMGSQALEWAGEVTHYVGGQTPATLDYLREWLEWYRSIEVGGRWVSLGDLPSGERGSRSSLSAEETPDGVRIRFGVEVNDGCASGYGMSGACDLDIRLR